MKRKLSTGYGMSSYRYSAKKSVWKWTTGKIIAFSSFGVVMATLIYIETSSISTISQDPVQYYEEDDSFEGNFQSAPTTDFEQQYQEFLKQGKKILTQDIIDSIVQRENTRTAVTRLETPNPPASARTQSNVERSNDAKRQPSNASNQSNTSAPVSTQSGVENNLKPVPLTSLNDRQDSQGIGLLEEIDPEDQTIQTLNQNATTETVIVEEFYTEDTVSGTIAALSDRTPLGGVIVTVKGTDIETVTDANGRYTIRIPGDPLYRTVHYSYRGNSTERDVAPGTEILNVRF
jgi:hypothetical protein